MRDTIMMYRTQCDALRALPPDQFKAVVTALWDYEMDGTEPQGDPVVMAMFLMAKPLIDRRNIHYENGKKGGRPPKKERTESEKNELIKARNSYEYDKWRKAVYERDGYTCQKCGATEDLQAHHIMPFDDYPDLRYDPDNGITLCRECHRKEHEKTEANREITKINREITELNLTEPNKTVKDKGKRIKVKDNIYSMSYPYKEVIDYLNLKAGTHFRESSKATQKHIKARFDEGFTLADFRKVIDGRVLAWKNDVKMSEYLRPETLFGSKFEGYLNAKPGRKNAGFNNFGQRDYNWSDLEAKLIQAQG